MSDLKDQIAANFSTAAPVYDQYATMQQQAALSLIRRLSEFRLLVPDGPILEVGCGTGAVSRGLITLFPDRRLSLVDLAPGMIAANRKAILARLPTPSLVDWQLLDAETIMVRRRYALIASCLTLQWFQDLPGTLARLGEALLPGGTLLCSFPGDDSFPEWRETCRALALPCTINPLPNGREVLTMVQDLGYEASIREETIGIAYPTVRAFFRSLKKTGTCTAVPRPTPAGTELSPRPTPAGTELSPPGSLTRTQLARLIATWQGGAKGPVTITYLINTLEVRA